MNRGAYDKIVWQDRELARRFILIIPILLVFISIIIHAFPVSSTDDAQWVIVKTKVEDYFCDSDKGKLSVHIIIYKLANDNNDYYDWYMIQTLAQIIPGQLLSGNGWKSADFKAKYYIQYYYSNHKLVGYAPTTTTSTRTVGWSVGLNLATIGEELVPLPLPDYAESYSIPEVVIRDKSNFKEHKVHLWFDIDEEKDSGSYTYLCRHMFIVRVPQDHSLMIGAYFDVQFMKFIPYQGWASWEWGWHYLCIYYYP